MKEIVTAIVAVCVILSACILMTGEIIGAAMAIANGFDKMGWQRSWFALFGGISIFVSLFCWAAYLSPKLP